MVKHSAKILAGEEKATTTTTAWNAYDSRTPNSDDAVGDLG